MRTSTMDKEKLIALVYSRRCLWDTTFKGYHIRENSKDNWKGVADELNVTSDVVKTKWRNLRDTFRRELQKEYNVKSGDGSRGSRWSYYSNMLFLREQLSPRGKQRHQRLRQVQRHPLPVDSPHETDVEMPAATATTTTIKSERDDDEEDDTDDVVEVDAASIANGRVVVESKPSSCSSSSSTATTTTTTPVCKREDDASTRGRSSANVLKINTRKFKHARKPVVVKASRDRSSAFGGRDVETDADFHFLMSLLPYLRAVPDARKLNVRTKLQQVFVDDM